MPDQNDKNDNAKKNSSRRALLKATGVAATAAVLPSTWTSPILKQIVVPAHAQTTLVTTTTTMTTTTIATTPV